MKEYIALLTQSGANAPIVNVKRNTLDGEVVWTRNSTGLYLGTLDGAFFANETIGSSGVIPIDQTMWLLERNDNDSVSLSVFALSDQADLHATISVEIKVYPAP